MGNTSVFDILPVVSQCKSAVQAMCGDMKGASETQENFLRGCPVVSQIRSAVEGVMGDNEAALETQKFCGRTWRDVSYKLPGVGHVARACYYAAGRKTEGKDIMLQVR
jgi:hypothetical protein